MMLTRWIGALGALLLVLGGTPAGAQSSADAFFHDAAQRYVAGDVAAARRAVERGLEAFPSDPRLQALRKKLKQRDEKRGGGRSSQRGQQSQQKRKRSGETRAQEQSDASEQGRRSQAEGSSNRPSSRRPDPDSSSADQTRRSLRDREREGTRGGPRRRAQALSRAQAARLLRALENQEKKLLREIRSRVQKGETVEKDW